ncbi:MAG: thioesterase [Clostridia bacterium]
MEQNIYTYTHTVTFDEIDKNGFIKLSSLLRHTQQAAGMQFEKFGYSYAFLKMQDIVFLISKYHIKISSYPKLYDTFHIKTWHDGSHGAQFIRYFNIYNNEDKLIGAVSSAWPIIKYSARHIIRPSLFPYELPKGQGLSNDMPIPSTIKSEQGTSLCYKRYIGYSVIDANNHLNNAVYTDIISDAIPELLEGRFISELLINYKNEVFAGETLNVCSKPTENGIYFDGKVEDKISFNAVIKLDK